MKNKPDISKKKQGAGASMKELRRKEYKAPARKRPKTTPAAAAAHDKTNNPYKPAPIPDLNPDRSAAIIETNPGGAKGKKSEERSRRQAAILRGINDILRAAITTRSERKLGLAILAVAEHITRSRYGVIGELRADGFYRIAASAPGNGEGESPDREGSWTGPDTVPADGLYGRVLGEGTPLLSNDPRGHPDSAALPPGHPPLESFLGVPMRSNGATIGIIAVANSDSGYTRDDLEALEALAPSAAEALRRMKAERALVESETRFKLALRNAPVSVAVQDRDLRFIWAYNQRTVNPDEVIGKTDWELFPREDAERLVALKRKVLETGEDVREFIWITSNGKNVYLDLYLEPYRDEAGQIRGVGIAAVDMTDIKKADDAIRRHIEVLRETNEELRSFNRTMVDRELRMIELKKQVNELCLQAGKKPPYNLDFEQENR